MGLSFVHKGLNAFQGSVVHHIAGHGVSGEGIGLVHAQFQLLVKEFFSKGDGKLGLLNNHLGQSPNFLMDVVCRHDLIDQSSFESVLCGDEGPRHEHFKGGFSAQVSGQGHTGGGAKETQINPAHGKTGSVGRNGEIALGDELTARCGCDALDLGDHGNGQGLNLQHQGTALRKEFLVIGLVLMRHHLLEIVSGAKGFSLGSKDNGPGRRIGIDLCKSGFQAHHHLLRQGIEGLWPVEGQGDDPRRGLFSQEKV